MNAINQRHFAASDAVRAGASLRTYSRRAQAIDHSYVQHATLRYTVKDKAIAAL